MLLNDHIPPPLTSYILAVLNRLTGLGVRSCHWVMGILGVDWIPPLQPQATLSDGKSEY